MTAEEMLAVMSTPVTAEVIHPQTEVTGILKKWERNLEEYYEEGSIEEGAEGMVTE